MTIHVTPYDPIESALNLCRVLEEARASAEHVQRKLAAARTELLVVLFTKAGL